ncbi:MAG: hypothetical protein ABWW65_02725 [Thermoprotei archaeon]
MEIDKVIPIRMSSLNDLIRLALAISTPQSTTYILRYRENERVVVGILGIFRDYYKLYGLPVFYYYSCSGEEAHSLLNANYIIVSSDAEKIEFSKIPKPGLSIPIIGLGEKPPFIPENL